MSSNVWQVFERNTRLPLICRSPDRTGITASEFKRRIQSPAITNPNPFTVLRAPMVQPHAVMLTFITTALDLDPVPSLYGDPEIGQSGSQWEFWKGFEWYAGVLDRYERAASVPTLPIDEVVYQHGLFIVGQAPHTPRFCSYCAAPLPLAFRGVPRFCRYCKQTTPLNPTVSPPPGPVCNRSSINVHNHYPAVSSPSVVRSPKGKHGARSRWSGGAAASH